MRNKRSERITQVISNMNLIDVNGEPIKLLTSMGSYDYSLINNLAARINVWAETKGFDMQVMQPSRTLLLIISEVIEAFEEYRDNKPFTQIYYRDEEPEKPEGFPIEIADAIIRLLDLAAAFEIDIAKSIDVKMRYNEVRPHKHGKQF